MFLHASAERPVSLTMRTLPLLVILFGGLSSINAQTNASLLSAVYSHPPPLLAPPEKFLPLFSQGVPPQADDPLPPPPADTRPLPLSLAGLSARVSQAGLT